MPDQPPDQAGLAALTTIGVILGLAGLVGYTRRDLR
jgi:putative exporter of polyketide antibiotics